MKTFYSKFILALIAFCFLISIHLKAQDTTFSASHLKAAEDMLIAMEMPKIMTNTLNNVLKVNTAKMPLDQQKAFSDTMNAFLVKYLNWEVLKSGLAKIYASEFSEAEIKELTKFYLTPLGKKIVIKSPILIQKGSLWGQQVAMAHQSDFKEMFEAALQKN